VSWRWITLDGRFLSSAYLRSLTAKLIRQPWDQTDSFLLISASSCCCGVLHLLHVERMHNRMESNPASQKKQVLIVTAMTWPSDTIMRAVVLPILNMSLMPANQEQVRHGWTVAYIDNEQSSSCIVSMRQPCP